jgi:hypothetical protein
MARHLHRLRWRRTEKASAWTKGALRGRASAAAKSGPDPRAAEPGVGPHHSRGRGTGRALSRQPGQRVGNRRHRPSLRGCWTCSDRSRDNALATAPRRRSPPRCASSSSTPSRRQTTRCACWRATSRAPPSNLVPRHCRSPSRNGGSSKLFLQAQGVLRGPSSEIFQTLSCTVAGQGAAAFRHTSARPQLCRMQKDSHRGACVCW